MPCALHLPRGTLPSRYLPCGFLRSPTVGRAVAAWPVPSSSSRPSGNRGCDEPSQRREHRQLWVPYPFFPQPMEKPRTRCSLAERPVPHLPSTLAQYSLSGLTCFVLDFQ